MTADNPPSLMQNVIFRYTERSPLSLMVRVGMEHAFSNATIIFLNDTATTEIYTKELAFSSAVDLMGLVVTGAQPSMRAAYHQRDTGITLKSVYEKLQNVEPNVSAALVTGTAERAATLIRAMKGERPTWLPGFQLRVLDGCHLAASERRLEVLHGCVAGPLPGHVLAVFDPALGLVRAVLPCEDGHAQERSLLPQVLAMVSPGECWIGDRNFCTKEFLWGIAHRESAFLIRQHGGMTVRACGGVVARGRVDTGEVVEQDVLLELDDGRSLPLRRITVRLDVPARDGDTELHLLTNIPREAAAATTLADLYRKRWSIETAFQQLTLWLNAELAPLGYPKAALFGFCVGLLSYNLLATVIASLRAVHGEKKVDEDVSGYLIAQDVRMNAPGLDVMVDTAEWTAHYRALTTDEIAVIMLTLARRVNLRRIPKAKTRTKKPPTPRTRYKNETHVSTKRLLDEKRARSS